MTPTKSKMEFHNVTERSTLNVARVLDKLAEHGTVVGEVGEGVALHSGWSFMIGVQ